MIYTENKNRLIKHTIYDLCFERKDKMHIGKLVLIDLKHAEQLLRVGHHFLSDFEKEKLTQIGSEKRKLDYLSGRVCSKIALDAFNKGTKHDQFSIDNGIFGFPIVKSIKAVNNLKVCISHTKSIGGAISFKEEHPVAIDIECVSADIQKFKEDIITEKEHLQITTLSINQDIAYTALWTAKEALSKILHTGLMTPFSLYETQNIVVHDYYIQLEYSFFPQYKCIIFFVKDCIISLALPRKSQLKFNFHKLDFNPIN